MRSNKGCMWPLNWNEFLTPGREVMFELLLKGASGNHVQYLVTVVSKVKSNDSRYEGRLDQFIVLLYSDQDTASQVWRGFKIKIKAVFVIQDNQQSRFIQENRMRGEEGGEENGRSSSEKDKSFFYQHRRYIYSTRPRPPALPPRSKTSFSLTYTCSVSLSPSSLKVFTVHRLESWNPCKALHVHRHPAFESRVQLRT